MSIEKKTLIGCISVSIVAILIGLLFIHVNSSLAQTQQPVNPTIIQETETLEVNDKIEVMSEQTAKEIASEIKAAEEATKAEQEHIEAEALAAEQAKLEAENERLNFINEWSVRLNNYLSGSPLSGYGETFASAAYDAGIDPRYSAAISCIESGKGANCFKSHNAWGWGSSSWSSWEEAIVAHTNGLAAGYGYTVSESAAKKYCPPNWSYWYSNVSNEMSKI